MDAGRLVQMLVNMLFRKAMNHGLKAGMKAMSRRGGDRGGDRGGAPHPHAPQPPVPDAARRARDAARMLRRFGR
jgi:hypothetical protein